MSEINTIKWQDLALENEPLRQQFMQYFREGYYFQALALITDNADIDSETVMPEVFNMINTALTFLQNLYYNSVEVVLSEDEQQFQMMINNFINKKAFDATATYVPYNFVSYNEQMYMCIRETTPGILPTNTTYWLLIGLKGEEGATAIEVQLRYDWDYQITYSPKDVVVYNNILYVAKNRNNNSQPDINPEDWEVFMKIPRAKVIVSPTEPNPDALEINGEWWKITEISDMAESEGNSVTVNDASTDFINSIYAEGNIDQLQTTGAQLFDASRFPTKTQGGATVTNNGDGTFTITGSGTLTEVYNQRITLAGDEARKLIGTPVTLSVDYSVKSLPFYIITIVGNGVTLELNNSAYITPIDITAEMIAAEDYNIKIGFYGRMGVDIIPATIKPMISVGQTVAPWEPFTNGFPTPSPDYPSIIKGFGYSSNLLDFEKWYETISMYTSGNYVNGITRGEAVWDLKNKSITLTASAADCFTSFSINVKALTIPVLPNSDYVFTWDYVGDIGKVYMFLNGTSDTGNIVSTNNTDKKLFIHTKSDTTIITFRVGVTNANETCTYSNLIIREANDYSTYMPYSGEKGIFNAITSGTQLFNESALVNATATSTVSTDKSQITVTGTQAYARVYFRIPVDLVAGQLLSLSCNIENGNPNVAPSAQLRVQFEDLTYKTFLIASTSGERHQSIPTGIIQAEFQLIANNSSTAIETPNTVIFTNVMLNIGNTSLPWVPFSGFPTTAQPIIPSPVYKLNNTADYLYRIGNNWFIKHNLKEVVLDGSLKYVAYNPLTLSQEIRPVGLEYTTNKVLGNILFDRFKAVRATWNIDEIGIGYGSASNNSYGEISLRIPVDANPNEYMDAHPTTVIFIPNPDLNYSFDEPLQDSKSIIELEQMKSFYSTTTLEINSQLEPTKVGLDYNIDIPLYMKNNYN